MPIDPSAQIHPTAIIDPEAMIGPNVVVGPYAIIEKGASLGGGCQVGPHVHLYGVVQAGQRNNFGTGCVIGGPPQHTGWKNEPGWVVIGDDNHFRETVTVHRGMYGDGKTVIGNQCYFMAYSHVAHDCRIGNRVIFANCAAIAGHGEVGDGVFISAYAAAQQYVRVGRLAFVSGTSQATKDVIPFAMLVNRNHIQSINVIGMRRAGISREDIDYVRQAHRILYRSGDLLSVGVEKLKLELGHIPIVQEILQFIAGTKKGVIGPSQSSSDDEE
ncbi:MAG: acyl-ACP--UDP-N-acetylglucosamine O-acyltransferase [Gemmataceae bacterium]|jgi:UDP-N-acetylglucosamine acyltransferase|nr:acyl-ACP--UDP-N-acetylglucosamine O-acyltransferase [Gemmataceae bacterium]